MLQIELKNKFIHDIEHESSMLSGQKGEFAIAKAILVLADAIEKRKITEPKKSDT